MGVWVDWLKLNRVFFTTCILTAIGFSILYNLVDYTNSVVEFSTLGYFIVLLGAAAYLKYDFRAAVLTAILLLITAAGLLATGSSVAADKEAVIAYYFLVVGVLGLFIDYIRDKNRKD